jgi:hypothetical protein
MTPDILSNSYHDAQPRDDAERVCLEESIRDDFTRCHPDMTLDDLRRRAAFSKEDRGLLRDWMAIAARQATLSPEQP